MKQLLILLVALGAFGLGACNDTIGCIEPSNTCITEKTQLFAKGASCKTTPGTRGASVTEYSFQSQLVYVFSPGNCGADEAAEVLDENCRSIGFLGGFGGNTKVNGESFEKAELRRTIWQQ